MQIVNRHNFWSKLEIPVEEKEYEEKVGIMALMPSISME
jgi:hypothetical protein